MVLGKKTELVFCFWSGLGFAFKMGRLGSSSQAEARVDGLGGAVPDRDHRWGFDEGCGGFGLQLRRCSKLGISFWWWWCCTLGLDLNRSEWRSSWYGVEVGSSSRVWVAETVMVGCW